MTTRILSPRVLRFGVAGLLVGSAFVALSHSFVWICTPLAPRCPSHFIPFPWFVVATLLAGIAWLTAPKGLRWFVPATLIVIAARVVYALSK